MEKNMILLKGRHKFWYLILAPFLLWLSLIYIYNWSLQTEKDEASLFGEKSKDLVSTHESKSVEIYGNQNGIIINETETTVNTNVTVNPMENFFIGGDWNKYVNEAAMELKQLMEEEERAKQIESDRRIKEERDRAARDKAKRVVDSVSVEETAMANVTRSENNEESDFDSSVDSELDESCIGKYVYMHDLPSEFNQDYINNCRSLNQWSNMCPFTSNNGLGPRLKGSDKVFSSTGWFETNQFMLEVIFHNRMKQYKCLTRNSSLASAIFVPYYAGLDVERYLWGSNTTMRDHHSLSLAKWVRERPEWQRMWGRDHFLVAGRITWDFRRLTDGNSDWGNQLMLLPESKNMTMLTIESSPWNNNDFAIPYPTYFHSATDDEVFQWQSRMRRMKRKFLFSFAGAPRPNITTSIRSEIISQCQASRRRCRLLDCNVDSNKCYKAVHLMKMFESSTFCLQPPGDSYTRRSTFDSILAGCIPVFFHPGSAYTQYLWHLPRDYSKYSVFIPENTIKGRKARIERILSQIPKSKVLAMREQVIRLIPRIIYADPSSSWQVLEDAFDITIDGVLERVGRIRTAIIEGKSFSDEAEELNWKQSLFGTVGKHEWDPFFERI